MGKKTPSAGKGWTDKAKSPAFRDGWDKIWGDKNKKYWEDYKKKQGDYDNGNPTDRH